MLILLDNNPSNKRTQYVRYRCDVCGCDGRIRYDHYLNGVGCSVCDNKKVVPGVNDLWTTRPDVAQYLEDKADGYRVTRGSKKRLPFKCPDCGAIDTFIVSYVSRHGFHCRACNSFVSYPNRTIAAALSEMDVQFSREKTFPWSGLKRYDFYVAPSTIIEVHGEQHYKGFHGGNFSSLEKIRNNDNDKRLMAINNGGIKHYIVINASKSEVGFIKNEIESSDMANLFDLSLIDWTKVQNAVTKGIFSDVMHLYRNGKSAPEISKELNTTDYIVRSCLKIGDEKGLCNYSYSKERLKGQPFAAASRKKPVICITTGEKFDSLAAASASTGVSPKALSNCLVGRSHSTQTPDGRKLKWNYL